MSRTTIYEPHPVSPERKAALASLGFKIIDAVFQPPGYVHPDAQRLAPAGLSSQKRASEGLKVEDLRAALEAKGVPIPEGAKKPDLQALLDASSEA